MAVRHFLTLLDLSKQELLAVLTRAIELKKIRTDGVIRTVSRQSIRDDF